MNEHGYYCKCSTTESTFLAPNKSHRLNTRHSLVELD